MLSMVASGRSHDKPAQREREAAALLKEIEIQQVRSERS